MSDETEVAPRVKWLTTQAVIDQFGFDPEPHVLDPDLKSKLARVGPHFFRVWHADSVAYHRLARKP